jgi:tetratricopeptide (TPR) repeat protein
MAPEQLRPVIARGTARDVILDERADVFSLGVTLFELAYGWYPFGNLPDDHDRQRSAGLLLERQKRGARLPDRRPAHVDRRLGEIILQCMAFEPGERPQSMDELLARLEGELKAVPRARRWLRSHRQLTATAATLACGAGLALGGWLATRDPYPIRELKNGQTALQTGNPAGAVKHFTAAFKTDPKLLEARFLRGCARYRDEDYLAAFADLEPLVEQLPDGRAAAALAHMHFQLRSDCHTAAAYYRKAAEQGCRTAAIYNNLAYCDMQTRVFDEAIEASKKASALNPELSSPYRLRILVAIQLTLHHRCVMDLPAIEEALQAHPESADLKSDAALYLFFAGRASDNEDFKRTAIDRTFDLLSEALDQGVPRTRLKPFLDADAELNGDPRWQALEARHASNVSSAREDLVIDPLDELTQPQSAAPTLPIRSHEPRTVSATSSR